MMRRTWATWALRGMAVSVGVAGCSVGDVSTNTSSPGLISGDAPTTDTDVGVDTDDGATSSTPVDTDEPPGGTDDTAGPSDDTGTDTAPVDCGGITCDPNATCEGDTCVCGLGFEGDGTSCTDLDGCADAPCFAGVTCTDEPAPGEGHSCGDCPTGYEGDGTSCSDVDGCQGSPCFTGVACTDVPAPGEGFDCGPCPTGYTGDGELCSDIDGCMGNPCYPGVTCSDVPAPGTGFSCGACPAGTFGDGIVCNVATQYIIGDTPNSGTLGPYFRGNGYVANGDGLLASFDVYLGLSGPCNLDFYVFSSAAPGGALTQLWRNTVAAGAGTSYRASGNVNLPINNGTYYVLGVGWNCSATYYWNSAGTWSGFDAGVGIFNNTRWDNAYPGPSDFYLPPNTGGGTTTYPHRVYFAG